MSSSGADPVTGDADGSPVMADAGADPVTGGAAARRRQRLWWLVTLAFGVVVTVAVGRALINQDWSVVGDLLRQRGGAEITLLLTLAVLVAVVGPLLGMLSWRRILLALGPPVPLTRVTRIFCVGFLARYVPGKVPGLIATVKVATASGVELPRMLVSGTLHMVLVHLTGLTVGLLTGVRVLGDQVVWLALPGLLVLVALAWPDLLGRAAGLALRLLRRPELSHSPSRTAIRVAVLWQLASWLVGAAHLWLLAIAMGADPAAALPLCLGAFSLASVLGVLAVLVPDGLGVREAAVTGALALLLPVPSAVAVAVASRLVTTFADVLLGAVVLGAAEIVHRKSSSRSDAALIREEISGHAQLDRS